MAKEIMLTRTEGEKLVYLLECCGPDESESDWRLHLAEEIRARFGMLTREEEAITRKNNQIPDSSL